MVKHGGDHIFQGTVAIHELEDRPPEEGVVHHRQEQIVLGTDVEDPVLVFLPAGDGILYDLSLIHI